MNWTSDFNEKLIGVINNYYPRKNDQILFLTDTFSLGKEAAYRRLRGEVHFSFAEACKLAKKLNISLDEIANSTKISRPVFRLKIHPAELVQYEYHKLYEHEASINTFLDGSVIYIQSISSSVPYSLLFPHENLTKFRLFKWIYQTENKLPSSKFSDIIVPEEIRAKQKTLAQKMKELPENTIIFDRKMFIAFAEEFKYFHKLGLVSDEEFEVLKQEFRNMLDDFETFTIYGKNWIGNNIWFYLLNIDFDFNYAYVKGVDFEMAYMDGIYLMDTIVSSDPQICRKHHEWIESVKKYSTLISVSGEKDRISFFEEQRLFIDNL